MQFIVDNAEASALIVQDDSVGVVEEIRQDIPINADRNSSISAPVACPAGYRDYEDFLAAGSASEPRRT